MKKPGKNTKQNNKRKKTIATTIEHPPCDLCSQMSHNISFETLKGRKLWLCATCRQHAPLILKEEQEDNLRKRKEFIVT